MVVWYNLKNPKCSSWISGKPQEMQSECNHTAAVQPDSSHDLGSLRNHIENIARASKPWGKASKRCDFLKFSSFSNEFQWNHMESDPTTVFRPRPRTASVSLQKHVGKWQYVHVMKSHWKGSETVYVFFMFFREFPGAFHLISIIKHSSSLRL